MTLKEILGLFLILSLVLFSRLFRLYFPSEMYFDEVYHVPAAMMLSEGDFQTPFTSIPGSYDGQHVIDWLHPPLAKYFQAFFMSFFGKHALAWRLPSVLMAFFTVLVFYFFLRFLGKNFFWVTEPAKQRNNLAINLALLGSFFLSLSGLFLTQSRIAMNDVFLLFFLLLAVFLYFIYLQNKSYKFLFLSLVVLGLALSSKWTALWIILLLFFRELTLVSSYKKLPFLFFCFCLTPLFIYLLSYLPMFLGGSNLIDFLSLQKSIIDSQLTNPNMHLYSSDPLSWWLNLRPVWFFAVSSHDLPVAWVANIYALENPLLSLYLSLTFVFIVISLLKKDQNSLARKAIWLLFGFYLASFLPWIFFTRPMFLHHYLPALPFLIAIMSYLLVASLSQIKDQAKRRAITFNLLFWPFFIFIIFYPHWVGLRVPSSFANAVYFLLPSWR